MSPRMSPRFGTSGLRGLVSELTPELVRAHVRAFLTACPHGGALWVGRDLRPSSPAIAAEVIAAARSRGLAVRDAGAVPTPALALAAQAAGEAAVMVTGSHIPADRNGLKFYTPAGELTKDGEAAILAALPRLPPEAPPHPLPPLEDRHAACHAACLARYAGAFGPRALLGLRIGVWLHSTVIGALLCETLAALGAEVLPLGRSARFVPVDTEALSPEARAQLAAWTRAHRLDALVSADGDGDRPLMADATGAVLPGDVLGPLTARALGAGVVVTPISSNSLVEAMAFRVRRTRIGSPQVIAGMEAERAGDPAARVVGYEANGGFLLGFAAPGGSDDAASGAVPATPPTDARTGAPTGAPTGTPAGLLVDTLPPLLTRDSLLPLLAPLAAARAAGRGIAALAAALPARFTAADRLQGIAAERALPFLAGLEADPQARAALLAACGAAAEAGLDRTDGLRITDAAGRVLHLRPSGNAPEFRVYTEAETPQAAQALLAAGLQQVARRLA